MLYMLATNWLDNKKLVYWFCVLEFELTFAAIVRVRVRVRVVLVPVPVHVPVPVPVRVAFIPHKFNNSHPHKKTNMRFVQLQPLDTLAQAADNETGAQEPLKKKKTCPRSNITHPS